MGARHLYSHADGYQCEVAATGEGSAGPAGIGAQVASTVPIATVSLWGDDGWLEHRAVTGDRIEPASPTTPDREHHYVVRAQSIADDLPAGPLVAYSSPTYVRSGSGGAGGT